MSLKFGRKPAVRNARTQRSAEVMAKAIAPLGAPPSVSYPYAHAVTAATAGDWGMLGNDTWGDCVQADDGHFLMLRTANTGLIFTPTETQILALYSAETGFNPNNPNSDQGTDETSDCVFMVSTGLLGHKAEATGYVDPSNLDHIKWCIELFGGCKLGINLPQSAVDQFNAGEPWRIVRNDGGIAGGHDVLAVQYDGEWFFVVTWGKLWRVEPAWLARYMDESHVLLFKDFIEKTGRSPAGFDLQTLLADLPSIEFNPPTGNHRHHRRRKHRQRNQR